MISLYGPKLLCSFDLDLETLNLSIDVFNIDLLILEFFNLLTELDLWLVDRLLLSSVT